MNISNANNILYTYIILSKSYRHTHSHSIYSIIINQCAKNSDSETKNAFNICADRLLEFELASYIYMDAQLGFIKFSCRSIVFIVFINTMEWYGHTTNIIVPVVFLVVCLAFIDWLFARLFRKYFYTDNIIILCFKKF